MVQYILTPWRNRLELLTVRQQFYPAAPASSPLPASSVAIASASASASASAVTTAATTATVAPPTTRALVASEPALRTQPLVPPPKTSVHYQTATSTTTGRDDQHRAVARVSMWMQRGNCPHMVESTALLTAAILSDEERGSGSAGTYAVRAAYAAAFSRFVTGLLDGHQDKQRKLSMYSVAKTIGLPATFVELRHQATHEQLPSLAKLRSAARKALVWIWEYYWQHLEGDDDYDIAAKGIGDCDATADAQRAVLMAFLEDLNGHQRDELRRHMEWTDEDQLLATLTQIIEAPPNNVVLLAALRLSREILSKGQGKEDGGEISEVDEMSRDTTQIFEGIQRARDTLTTDTREFVDEGAKDPESEEIQDSSGWAMFEGTWKPRPIGVP